MQLEETNNIQEEYIEENSSNDSSSDLVGASDHSTDEGEHMNLRSSLCLNIIT